MYYHISRNSYSSQFIQINLQLQCEENESVQLQLPTWRPGRYELANYAHRIRSFSVSFQSDLIPWTKIRKDLWQFEAIHKGTYHINYDFFANQMDAGGCWSDDQQLYLNFSNCAFEVLHRKEESIAVDIALPPNFQIASALQSIRKTFFVAKNFQHLIDSPLVASPTLKHFSYIVDQTLFHMWFQGEIHFEVNSVLKIFQSFSLEQIKAFGEFPETEYHFIIQLLPYPHYHGVEHSQSTVITIGPTENIVGKPMLDKLVGIASHELYHAWNVCKIRPTELLPFDLSQEILIDAGLVLEGVTTYMGDQYLLKSGYYTMEEYIVILEKQINREAESLGWKNQSITESSLDLWLDGYTPGIPDKKVSIYNRGALISLYLDLRLNLQDSSLQEVMREMWGIYGKNGRGYTLKEFEMLVISKFLDKRPVHDFFEKVVYGTEDLLPFLQFGFDYFNINIDSIYTADTLLHHFGVKIDEESRVIRIHSESNAYHQLMLGDLIIALNDHPFSINTQIAHDNPEFTLIRHGREIKVPLQKSDSVYYPVYKLKVLEENSFRRKWIS